jgi:HSP20 family protein
MTIFNDLFGDIERWQRKLDNPFSLSNLDKFFSPGLLDYRSPVCINTEEDKDSYMVAADIPGMNIEDFNIEYDNGMLTISGERKQPEIPEDAKVFRNEIWKGSFRQSISVSKDINPDGIEAKYNHGILQIKLPKIEEKKPKAISVKVD